MQPAMVAIDDKPAFAVVSGGGVIDIEPPVAQH